MTNRISLSVPPELQIKLQDIPDGSRSMLMRRLLESYFDFASINESAFGMTLKGNIKISEEMKT